jgi:hypothetical protein
LRRFFVVQIYATCSGKHGEENQMSDVATETEVKEQAQGAGDATQQNADKETPKFTQSEVDRLIGERLQREKAKATEAAEKARKEAEEKALADNAKWQELAETRGKDNEALKAQAERAERLEAALTKRWDAEKSAVPDYILPLLEKMSVDERLDYITDNRAKWEESATRTNGGRVAGMPSGNAGRITSEESERARQQDALATRRLF